MITFKAGDRVLLKDNPRTHGEVKEVNGKLLPIRVSFDGGYDGWYEEDDLEHVPFPVGSKVRMEGWLKETPSEKVIEELGSVRFTKGGSGHIYSYHISQLVADGEGKEWVPAASERCFYIMSDGIGSFRVDEREYNANTDGALFKNGFIRRTMEEAERVVDAMLKAAKKTV